MQRFRVQLDLVNATVAAPAKQAGFFEDPQMFGNGGQRHPMGASQLGDALISAGEMGEDAAAGRIGQGSEGPVEVV